MLFSFAESDQLCKVELDISDFVALCFWSIVLFFVLSCRPDITVAVDWAYNTKLFTYIYFLSFLFLLISPCKRQLNTSINSIPLTVDYLNTTL